MSTDADQRYNVALYATVMVRGNAVTGTDHRTAAQNALDAMQAPLHDAINAARAPDGAEHWQFAEEFTFALVDMAGDAHYSHSKHLESRETLGYELAKEFLDWFGDNPIPDEAAAGSAEALAIKCQRVLSNSF